MNPTVRRVAALGALVLIVVLLGLLFWPRAAADPEVAVPAPVEVREPPKRASAGGATAAAKDQAELVEGPSEDELPTITPKCELMVGWHEANVPMWVIQDNAMAQGFKFTEEDLACLTAGGLPPGILDYAEANMLRFPVRKPEP